MKNKKVGKISTRQGLKFNTSKGQHILKNPLIIDDMIKRANVSSTDIVLEIGPGTGNLTAKLLKVAKKVIVIEIDVRMVAELHKRFRTTSDYRKLQIINGDALKVNLPFFNICVSNLPYQISSPIIFRLLKHRPSYRCCVLMVQREFAKRLVAKPSEECYSRLSANVQLFSKVEMLLKVSRKSFNPPPRVDSSVVRLELKPVSPSLDYDEWDGLLRTLFIRKNKTINSAFKSKKLLEVIGHGKDIGENVKKILRENKLDKVCKGEEENPDAFESDIGGIFKSILSNIHNFWPFNVENNLKMDEFADNISTSMQFNDSSLSQVHHAIPIDFTTECGPSNLNTTYQCGNSKIDIKRICRHFKQGATVKGFCLNGTNGNDDSSLQISIRYDKHPWVKMNKTEAKMNSLNKSEEIASTHATTPEVSTTTIERTPDNKSRTISARSIAYNVKHDMYGRNSDSNLSLYGIAMSSGALGTILIILFVVVTYNVVRVVKARRFQNRLDKANQERKKMLRLQKLSSLISDDSENEDDLHKRTY